MSLSSTSLCNAVKHSIASSCCTVFNDHYNKDYQTIAVGKMAHLLRFLIIFSVFSWSPLLKAEINLSDPNTKLQLNEKLLYVEESKIHLPATDAIPRINEFSPADSKNPNYGLSNQGVWLLAELTNSSDAERWVVEVDFAQNTRVEFYVVQGNKIVSSSKQGKNNEDQFARIPTHKFMLTKGSSANLLIYVANDSLNRIAPVILKSETKYEQSIVFGSLLWGCFYGGLLILVVYNLVQFFSTSERSILAYVVYIMSVIFWQFVWGGHYQLYELGMFGTWLGNHVDLIFIMVGLGSGLFTLSFLNASETAPNMIKFIYGSVIALCASGVLSALNLLEASMQGLVTNIVSIFAITCYTITGFESYFNHFKPARYFIFAWSILAFCALTGMLSLVGVLPASHFTAYIFPIGVFIEAGLFSLALLDKIRSNLRFEVYKATRELRNNLIYIEEQNARLDISRKSALTASKVKSQFLANMSHEIRTPLNAIIGFCQELQGLVLPKEKQQHVEIINSSASHLMHIINDVLDFSKIEAGKLEIKNEVFSPLSLVEQLAALMSKQAYNKGLEFVLDIQPLPQKLLGDAPRIRQILTNLLSNAIKFTPFGHVSMRVESKELDNNLIELCVTVEDTGIGIADNDKKKIFAAFSQLDDEINRTYQGTGLGLVICQQLVKLMHGHLNFESAPGTGTSFALKLNLNRLTYKQEPEGDPRWRGASIAILDSYPYSRRATASMFRQFGAKVTSIDSLAFFDSIREEEFDYLFASCSVEWLYKKGIGIKHLDTFPAKNKVLTYSSNEDLSHLAVIESGFSLTIERPLLPSSILKVFEPVEEMAIVDERETLLKALPPVKILAVDDTEINLHLLSTWLKRSPVQLSLCFSGSEAIERCKQDEFDLILMDLQMPEIDGITATKEIRQIELNQGTPIIAMTAHAFREEKEQMLQQGMDDYLPKPIDFQMLISLINLWCDYQTSDEIEVVEETSTTSAVEVVEESIDWQSALKITGGSEFEARNMLKLFLEQLQPMKVEIESHYQSKDWDELARVTHKIHGACCYTGVPALKHYCSLLETSLKINDIQSAETMFVELLKEADRVTEAAKIQYAIEF
ncbi:hybrid sensor histidine kinase/response regulator [Alteromonadaceae bacterium M269]|nr:hybrid sensor histidine kinase/response regulator [Alteromonadaceae bacterium M269]